MHPDRGCVSAPKPPGQFFSPRPEWKEGAIQHPLSASNPSAPGFPSQIASQPSRNTAPGAVRLLPVQCGWHPEPNTSQILPANGALAAAPGQGKRRFAPAHQAFCLKEGIGLYERKSLKPAKSGSGRVST